jgi:hypothetical protein
MLEATLAERKKAFQELAGTSDEGKRRRELLALGIRECQHEFNGLGIEMNQLYESSAVYSTDNSVSGVQVTDPVLYYNTSTKPGSRLPHAWLNKAIPGKPISTIDLAGNGRFALFTGTGGDAWRRAAAIASKNMAGSGSKTESDDPEDRSSCRTSARAVSSMLPLEVRGASRAPSLDIRVWSIGWRLDWEDVYLDWMKKREISENGCLLVRPDRTIAWRCMKLEDVHGKEVETLEHVLRQILGLAKPLSD